MVGIIRIGVACVVMRGGHLLLGKRKNAHNAGTWGMPGGHLELGERIADCAARELREETGLEANHIQLLDFVEDFLDSGTRHYITFFVNVEAATGKPRLLEPEKCEGWQWFPFDELPNPLLETIPTYLNKRALEGKDPFKSSDIVESVDF